MIIGIGGISNSGKSALAERIRKHYDDRKVKVLCQDDFARPTPRIPVINGHTNWETPESIDFDKYYLETLKVKDTHDIVINEGLFVFYDERLNRLYDKQIYLTISKETFLTRKRKDLRWGSEPEWYMEHIWNSHRQFMNEVPERTSAFQVSGEGTPNLGAVIGYLDIQK